MAETGEIAADPDGLLVIQRGRQPIDLFPLIGGKRRTWKFQLCHRKQAREANCRPPRYASQVWRFIGESSARGVLDIHWHLVVKSRLTRKTMRYRKKEYYPSSRLGRERIIS